MTKRLPVIATIVVIGAVALMVGLGIWQLQRAKWKEGLLAQYAQAEKLPPIAWPTMPLRTDQLPLFRHATGVCLRPVVKTCNRGREPQGRTRLCPDRRLLDWRGRAWNERRGRLVQEPERRRELARRTGQRGHCARSAHAYAAGRGIGAGRPRAKPGRHQSRAFPTTTSHMRCNGSASLQSRSLSMRSR